MSRAIGVFRVGQTWPDEPVMKIAMRNSVWESAIVSLNLVTGDDVLWADDDTRSDTPLSRLLHCQWGASPDFSSSDCIKLDRALTELMPSIMAHNDIDDEDKTNLLRLRHLMQVVIEIGGVLEVSG